MISKKEVEDQANLRMGQSISQWSKRLHQTNIQKGFHNNPGPGKEEFDRFLVLIQTGLNEEIPHDQRVAFIKEHWADFEEVIESVKDACSINPSGRTIWTMLGNIVCEVSEAWEEVREGTFNLKETIRWETDKYGNDKPEGIGPELADILIRTMDTAEALGIDLERMVAIKSAYNETRKSKHGGKRI